MTSANAQKQLLSIEVGQAPRTWTRCSVPPKEIRPSRQGSAVIIDLPRARVPLRSCCHLLFENFKVERNNNNKDIKKKLRGDNCVRARRANARCPTCLLTMDLLICYVIGVVTIELGTIVGARGILKLLCFWLATMRSGHPRIFLPPLQSFNSCSLRNRFFLFLLTIIS